MERSTRLLVAAAVAAVTATGGLAGAANGVNRQVATGVSGHILPTSGAGATTECVLASETLAALGAAPGNALPDSPAGDQLRWVLDESAGAGIEALEERFSTEFLAAVPASQLTTIFAEIGATEITISEVVPLGATQLAAVLDTPEGAVVATIVVEAEPPHRISGLLFQSDTAAEPLPADVSAISTAIAALPGESQVLVAEYLGTDDDGDAAFDELLAVDADASGPIGSAFKLWVLGALGEAIVAGDVSWADELIIDDAVRSLPSGVLQDCPDDSSVSVADAAALMIAISDNTATDALITLVGRDAVEQQMVTAGVSSEAIARTLPLTTTQELFHLKFDGDDERLDAYIAGSVDERREILDGLPDGPPAALEMLAPEDRTAVPVAIDTVEWFASPRDLARTFAALAALDTSPGLGELDSVLGRSPGVALDPATWSNAWFKGGSEPGVLTLAWLLTRADGRQFVVVVMHTDTSSGLPAPAVELIADAAIRLAADHP